MSARETTRELLQRLERHYVKPGARPAGGTFITECGLNNGQAAQSRVDALYVGFTSASGRLLVGHEVKASRADWRKELDTAGKADVWADNCHEWWIVAPGPDVVPKEEIPHGWGLMYPSARSKTRMDKVVRPTTHADRHPSWLIVRSILARLDTLQTAHDAAVVQKAAERAREEHQRLREQDERHRAHGELTEPQRRRLEALDRIEKALGVEKIESWKWSGAADPDTIDADTAAAALQLVELVRTGGLETPAYYVDGLRRAADAFTASLVDFEVARDALLKLGGKGPSDQF